ncbi:MAG: diacylglycerol kinase [Candidatus Eremiobacteraeota bacterium]|nr:diacylglycerol kinase [Candidatus Eremiobacteraeota bacterium]
MNAPEPHHDHHDSGYVKITETKFWSSFHYAFQGILYAAKTQPNMRVHLVIAALVLLATLLLHVERAYVVAIIVVIVLVLSLELLNTAIESVVDLLTVVHHPLAKTAKDAAAGAVLIATIGAVVVGYLCFYQSIQSGGQRVFDALAQVPANTAFIIIAVTAIATIFAKAFVGRGSALQGGAVSAHAALAFAAATILALFYQKPLAALVAYFVALLVAQSRVEARIHSVSEVSLGAVLGTLVALAVYFLVRPHVVL